MVSYRLQDAETRPSRPDQRTAAFNPAIQLVASPAIVEHRAVGPAAGLVNELRSHMARSTAITSAVERFYDQVRGSGPSLTALAHGARSIGQECALTDSEIAAFARRAGLDAGMVMLDVGSGQGGPACYLACEFGCRVLGVELSSVGHAAAEARARQAGLGDRVEFRQGDMHTVDLPAGGFDVVLSLDALCHIPRRAALLRRCAQLLRPGGRLAFYDHVERRRRSAAERRSFDPLWRFAGLETPASYLRAVATAGLQVVWHEATSDCLVRFYSGLGDAFLAERTNLEAVAGSKRYAEGLERLRLTHELAAAGVIGQLGCIAQKPG